MSIIHKTTSNAFLQSHILINNCMSTLITFHKVIRDYLITCFKFLLGVMISSTGTRNKGPHQTLSFKALEGITHVTWVHDWNSRVQVMGTASMENLYHWHDLKPLIFQIDRINNENGTSVPQTCHETRIMDHIWIMAYKWYKLFKIQWV